MNHKYTEIRQHICVFVNVDWFVLSHFTHYLVALLKADYKVSLITSDTGRVKDLENLGINVVCLNNHRGFSNIFNEVKTFFSLLLILKKLNIDILELITIKPVVYGGLCSKILRINKVVYYMSGLGSEFLNTSFFGNIKRFSIFLIYKYLMKSLSSRIIVENKDDYKLFYKDIAYKYNNIKLVSGVGVDLSKFYPSKMNDEKILKVAVVSRLLKDKGIIEYFKAVKLLNKRFDNVIFLAAGSIDPTNSSSLSKLELNELEADGAVNFISHVNDVASFLRTVDIFVLPSYREGFPKAIMEASATGIPTVASNVTGCRDAVINNKTGILVAPKDFNSLANSLSLLIESHKLRSAYGAAARVHAIENFDVKKITDNHISFLIN